MSDVVTQTKLIMTDGKTHLEDGMPYPSLVPSSSSSLPLLGFLATLKLIPGQTRTFGDGDVLKLGSVTFVKSRELF